ncbi:hypothetical protein [Staphylococcus aureus]|uniref:hypothetical protein n=1 Tax=Staphylococcus aureus TaxID=1280 RepID=UPI00069DA06D|nr:hypothetical protein [Staphylococcus aureus]
MTNEKFEIFKEVLKHTDKSTIEEQYLFSEEDYKRFDLYIKKLEKDDFKNAKEKGEYFEEFIIFILTCSNIFECTKNIRTNTNEIDIRAEFSPPAKDIAKYYDIKDTSPIYFECKNYRTSEINVTYVGKFFSLLSTTNKNLGVMVSPQGITGTPKEWTDGYGLCKKIRLKYNINIISISYEDLFKLKEKSMFQIINEKLTFLAEDFDITQHITQHPLEDEFKKYEKIY